MGDDKKLEELEDVSGGPDTVAPIITDALDDVDGGDPRGGFLYPARPSPLDDVDGGADTVGDAPGTAMGTLYPLDDVEAGDGAQTPVNPQITD